MLHHADGDIARVMQDLQPITLKLLWGWSWLVSPYALQRNLDILMRHTRGSIFITDGIDGDERSQITGKSAGRAHPKRVLDFSWTRLPSKTGGHLLCGHIT